MGTIVLFPQDCLSSPHNCQNSYLASPRSSFERSLFQGKMVLSSTAEDSATHKHGGQLPPGDGLLPIPPVHSQARISTKNSPSSKTSFPVCPPHVQSLHSGPYPRPKVNLSRSAPAILPTPSTGSPPLAEGLSKGRLPFKIVQGSGPGNIKDFMCVSSSKRPNDSSRNRSRKGITATDNHVPKEKARRKFVKLKSPFKVPQSVDGLQGVSQSSDMTSIVSLERRNSLKAASDKRVTSEAPVVKILKRPETQEAAAELFARFFQNGTEQASFYSNDGMEVVSCKSEKACAANKEKEQDSQVSGVELSDSESSEGSSCESGYSPLLEGTINIKKDVKMLTSASTQGNTVPCEAGLQFDGGVSQNTKGIVFEGSCEELASWERWAGPSYINSPPPSALPLPRFSKKHLKLVTVDDVHETHFEDVSDQVLTSPAFVSPLYASLGRQRPLNINLDAVATATKDLKRILNLDLCRL